MSMNEPLPFERQTYGANIPTGPMPAPIPGGMMPAPGGMMPMFPSPAIAPTGYPTGLPLGPQYAPIPGVPPTGMIPTAPPVPAVPPTAAAPTPQTVVSTYYTAGFLRTQIGRRIRVEFLIGTNAITDRSGVLIGVGASYILLRSEQTGEIIMCDLYSIKFVTIYPMGQAIPLNPPTSFKESSD